MGPRRSDCGFAQQDRDDRRPCPIATIWQRTCRLACDTVSGGSGSSPRIVRLSGPPKRSMGLTSRAMGCVTVVTPEGLHDDIDVWAIRSTAAAIDGDDCPDDEFAGTCTSTRLPSGTPARLANGPPAATGSSCGPVPLVPSVTAVGQVDPADSPVQVRPSTGRARCRW